LRGHDHEQETRSEETDRLAKGREIGTSVGAEAATGAGRRARTEDGQEGQRAARPKSSSP
jgi:hypothetical protein